MNNRVRTVKGAWWLLAPTTPCLFRIWCERNKVEANFLVVVRASNRLNEVLTDGEGLAFVTRHAFHHDSLSALIVSVYRPGLNLSHCDDPCGMPCRPAKYDSIQPCLSKRFIKLDISFRLATYGCTHLFVTVMVLDIN